MYSIGSIVLLNRKKGGFFSSAQRFFTGKHYTHSTFISIPYAGEDCVLSTDELTCILPLENYLKEEYTDIEIYEVLNIDYSKKYEILKKIFKERAGKPYAYLQLLWFVWRWFAEKFLRLDLRKSGNWFPDNHVCSEDTYNLMKEYFLLKKDKYKKFGQKLDEWNSNCINAGEIADIVKEFPEIFKLVYIKSAKD